MLVRAFESMALLVVLLNPFLMTIYLMDLIRETPGALFRNVMTRAAIISSVVFIAFALSGDYIFNRVLQVRLASFQIFGGIIFLMIGVQFVMNGTGAISRLRGSPAHLAGAIAMPFMIGPGTVSASIIAGARLTKVWSVAAILVAVAFTVACVVGLKFLHDAVKQRHEPLVERYVEVVGRISALIIGTIAIEMIITGVEMWLRESPLMT